ncbi:MAG: hypothetical protein RIS44_3239 [Pseudomonadota bacterium]
MRCAGKEEQRGKQAAARRIRVRSARTKLDLALEANKVSIHEVLRGIEERPGEICGLEQGCWESIFNDAATLIRHPARCSVCAPSHHLSQSAVLE